jgi:hypothetical protein
MPQLERRRLVMVNEPTLAEWRHLYDLAARIKTMTPWGWMDETDVFGVQDPVSGETGYVSIMGALGEHLAVTAYLGTKTLYEFWEFQDEDSSYWPDGHLLEMPQLQVSFLGRDELEPADRALMKQLGLTFRGKQAYPVFRSYLPGYVPVLLNAPEARFMTHILEQVLDVAPRIREDDAILLPGDDDTYLVRVAHMQGDQLMWEDTAVHLSPPDYEPLPISVDTQVLETLKKQKPGSLELEVDLILIPARVQEKADERPRFPYALGVIDARTGFIFGIPLLTVETSLEEMWARVPDTFVHVLADHKLAPYQVTVPTGFLLELLTPVSTALGFKLRQSDDMPQLRAAVDSLFQSLAGD